MTDEQKCLEWLKNRRDQTPMAGAKRMFGIAISALEKQEAKRAEMGWDINFGKVRPHCPVCRESNPMEANYCWNCGQRIKTEEES